jgi:tetratricopeptide (TPR) repeat protein
MRRYNCALEAFDQVIDLNPIDARALVGKSNALPALGRYSESCDSFERAFKIGPGNAKASCGSALALRMAG